MYDAKKDPLIGEYFGEYLESIHDEVCRTSTRAVKVMRTTERKPIYRKTIDRGLPDARRVQRPHDRLAVDRHGRRSTGRVIALVAPAQGREHHGHLQLGQVLRHEYTHTVTLGATDNRIQHWMTEGLAVYEEKTPLRWDWVPMLYNAVKKKELFTMDNLTWAFVRPKKPHRPARSLTPSRTGSASTSRRPTATTSILKMLEEFKNAGRQEDVFPKITGKSIPEFRRTSSPGARSRSPAGATTRRRARSTRSWRRRRRRRSRPKQFDEAIAGWEEIGKLRPVDALPHQRLAGLYLDQEAERRRRSSSSSALHKVELKDNRYAKRIARHLPRRQEARTRRAKYAMEAVYIDPYDLRAHELLAEIYEGGRRKGLEREKRVIPVLTKWIEDQKAEAAGGVSRN